MLAKDLKPSELLGSDPATGLPLFGAARIVLLGGKSALMRLQRDLTRSIGARTAGILMARFGYESGMALATAMGRLYHFDNTEESLRAGSVLRTMAGMAAEQITRIDMDVAAKRLTFEGSWRESIEAEIWRSQLGHSRDPVCRILTGMASGYASTVLGEEVLVKELHCRAQGHPACRFEGRTVKEWGMDPEEVRAYFAVSRLEDELARLRRVVDQTRADMAQKTAEIRSLRRRVEETSTDPEFLFRSESMARLKQLAQKVAPTGSTILILGESGTGKEVLARFIHRNSGRHLEPFLAINCAALPPQLLESELFGHKRGAFTGADSDRKGLFVEAGKGTLFLDEIGDLPLEIQAKLLRALQEKEIRPLGGTTTMPVKARIVAATNQNLGDMVTTGQFRQDLFFRLAVFPIEIPPLRRRPEDVLILARHFLSRQMADHPGFSPEAVRKMAAYSWPGNIRELENWVEYAVVLAGKDRILPEHLPSHSPGEEAMDPVANLAHDLPSQEEMIRRYTRLVLDHTGGNKKAAAAVLGIGVTTLWRRLKENNQEGGSVD